MGVLVLVFGNVFYSNCSVNRDDVEKMNTSSLIDKISLLFKKQARVAKREDTTETSFDTNLASFYYKRIKHERTRKAKYADYAIMDDEYPEISSALDLYADNATKDRTDGNPIQVKSEDARVQNILDDLIDRTKIQEMLWDTARDMEIGRAHV